ncbi:MAG: hypothetical protein ABIG32_03705 [Candidatus Uhrbacteria bacterium]|nr:hypothetical protein [Patescibacteria group bacterium]MBU1907243.1 hypothetical protein [Patescibacteria group bacterium]
MTSSYIDLYDRQTIKECLWLEESLQEGLAKTPEDDPERPLAVNTYNVTRNIALMITKGERAARKEVVMREWEEESRRRKERVDSAKPRADIRCLTCGDFSTCDFKTDWSDQERERVLLMYKCPKGCLPHRSFFDDAEEYAPQPTLCKKCDGKTTHEDKRDGDLITTTYACVECGYADTDQIDLTPRKEEPVNEAHRKEYCLDAEGLEEYREMKHNMDSLKSLVESFETQKKDTKTNERMERLQKLRVAGLKEKIMPALEVVGMNTVELSAPVNERGIKVRFTMLDSDQEREDSTSKRLVKKTIAETLYDTNWRLIISSIESTLGAISGELRGYTSDDELRKVVEKENVANTSRT